MQNNENDIVKYRRTVDEYAEHLKAKRFKQALHNIAQKRFKTTFIAAVAAAEDIFGHLWNHKEEDDSKITDEQWKNYELYEKFRKRVLDIGNNQFRLFEEELDKYKVEYYV